MLADMATDLEAARALLYMAAAKVTANAPDKSRFSAMAKRLATDNGSKIVNDALQLFGGYGYLKDYPIERFWRDLRVHSILEGTNQVMRMIVGRDLLRSEEHTSELQSLMRISYAVFCWENTKKNERQTQQE